MYCIVCLPDKCCISSFACRTNSGMHCLSVRQIMQIHYLSSGQAPRWRGECWSFCFVCFSSFVPPLLDLKDTRKAKEYLAYSGCPLVPRLALAPSDNSQVGVFALSLYCGTVSLPLHAALVTSPRVWTCHVRGLWLVSRFAFCVAPRLSCLLLLQVWSLAGPCVSPLRKTLSVQVFSCLQSPHLTLVLRVPHGAETFNSCRLCWFSVLCVPTLTFDTVFCVCVCFTHLSLHSCWFPLSARTACSGWCVCSLLGGHWRVPHGAETFNSCRLCWFSVLCVPTLTFDTVCFVCVCFAHL